MLNSGLFSCEFWFLQFKYPESCMEFKYDPSFPIRGLYYDKVKGCLMKLDFFGSIEPGSCYFGRRKVQLFRFFEQIVCAL